MRVLWNHILQSPKSQEELAMINVTTMTFDTIKSGSGSRLGFTTLGAFSEPTLDGRDLWSPGQETIALVTLLICPYDSSFILPDIYVVPLTCTLEAQTVPRAEEREGEERLHVPLGEVASIPLPTHMDPVFLQIIPLTPTARSLARLERGSQGGRAGA